MKYTYMVETSDELICDLPKVLYFDLDENKQKFTIDCVRDNEFYYMDEEGETYKVDTDWSMDVQELCEEFLTALLTSGSDKVRFFSSNYQAYTDYLTLLASYSFPSVREEFRYISDNFKLNFNEEIDCEIKERK